MLHMLSINIIQSISLAKKITYFILIQLKIVINFCCTLVITDPLNFVHFVILICSEYIFQILLTPYFAVLPLITTFLPSYLFYLLKAKHELKQKYVVFALDQ